MSRTPILRHAILTAAAPLLAAFALSTRASAQSSQLDREAYRTFVKALKEANKTTTAAINEFLGVQSAAVDALQGKSPTFQKMAVALAAEYDQATQQVESAPLPQPFTSAQPVSLEELKNCATRPAAIAKLKQSVADIAGLVSETESASLATEKQLAAIPGARDAIKQVRKLLPKLMGIPAYRNNAFGEYLDADKAISALGRLEKALKKRRDVLTRDLPQLRVQSSNLASNVSALEQEGLSPIQGTWRGSAVNVDVAYGGGGPCSYYSAFTGVEISISVTKDGGISQASLSGTQTERHAGACNTPVFGQRRLELSGGGSTNCTAVSASLNPSGGHNAPGSIARFNGQIQGGRLTGTLTISRTDLGGVLGYTATMTVR